MLVARRDLRDSLRGPLVDILRRARRRRQVADLFCGGVPRIARRHCLPAGLVMLSMLCSLPRLCAADQTLPGTELLTTAQPLDEVMLAGLRRACLRELATSRERRPAAWNRDYSDARAYEASVQANRQRLSFSIGAVDPRVTADPAGHCEFEIAASFGQSAVIARSQTVTVHTARWRVLEGVTAEGLLLVPEVRRAGVVALPDADWTPEMFAGVSDGLPESAQFVRRLADAGCLVVIPTLISRSDEFSGSPHVAWTNQPHREFLCRQAFVVGRHPIGYEVQKVLAAVDLLAQLSESRDRSGSVDPWPLGVAGVGEGGLIALYAAALDQRLRSSLVCGYFQEREDVWQEPIYRNVWGLLTEFGDAELASLVAPRRLVIEASSAVEIPGPPAVRDGRRECAAPGRIVNNRLSSVRAEFARAAAICEPLEGPSELFLVVSGAEGHGPPGTDNAVRTFAAGLGVELGATEETAPWQPADQNGRQSCGALRDRVAREKRQFDELQAHVQTLLRRSARVRDAIWSRDPPSADAWHQLRASLRDRVHEELIGRLTATRLPAGARTRLVTETDNYAGYEVMLDVADDVIAGGILLLPNDQAPGAQRPLVVCQHGLEGTPMDTISHDSPAFGYYRAFSEELVRRGFVVYAPQNPYRGGNRFRRIQRMANPLKRSLFSYVIAQHEQTLEWLATLPQVDSTRIAFYGLSYGGKTALRVPPLVDRYCLSICSGDFTEWVRAIASSEDRCGYIFTGEYEVPEWNMAHLASHAELAMLMAPRPFMVEAGHRDGGQPTEWVAGEFGKVRRHYDQLNIGDRTELEFFDGPHTIHARNTFDFLHRHLNWPRQPPD